jgi:hypothetical protein
VPRPSLARLKRIAPWLVAVAILGWLFTTVPVDALYAALARVPPLPYLLLAVGFVVVMLCADAFACFVTIRYSLPESALRYVDVLSIRGVSYLLGLVNYGVGQGSIAVFLKQRHGVPLPAAFGVVLLMLGINVSLVAAAAVAGLLFGGAPAQPAVRMVVYGLACMFPAYLLIVALKPRLLARVRLLAPLFAAGLRGNLICLAARTPHVVVLLGGHFLAMRLFGVRPSPGQALTLLPLIFFVAVVPLSPFGLGTAQATAVALLAPFAQGTHEDARQAAVLAYSLSFQMLGMLVQALVGLAFLRRVTRADTVKLEKPP